MKKIILFYNEFYSELIVLPHIDAIEMSMITKHSVGLSVLNSPITSKKLHPRAKFLYKSLYLQAFLQYFCSLEEGIVSS